MYVIYLWCEWYGRDMMWCHMKMMLRDVVMGVICDVIFDSIVTCYNLNNVTLVWYTWCDLLWFECGVIRKLCDVILVGYGGIRLIVGFQPHMVISPTASWIRWCMQVYACELIWTCLVWGKRSTPDIFRCQATDSISPQVSRNESLRLLILTPSRPVGKHIHKFV